MKILSREEIAEEYNRPGREGIVVFTNGCFDILHAGHVDYLQRARALGDLLVVGMNSDDSVRRLKGECRPVNSEQDRAAVLAGLECVDRVVIFDEETPLELIRIIRPQVLVKGGDWPVERIVGREIVQGDGGRVLSLELLPGYSTTGIIKRILSMHGRLSSRGTS
ncbi:MAG TPA: D-glycero-beta-D-manno-heptose 1-phosphate adenylyltransferase [Desulfomicrobiaceae bacterium]|nr:D-glycero-beta-D-manno-heptose 1-phosphate adenylyltransferase [Desulfomicrobiaceae bacterium]